MITSTSISRAPCRTLETKADSRISNDSVIGASESRVELELLNLLLESEQCHSSYRIPKEKYQSLKPQELYEYFGFKVDIYSCKIIDENSRMVAEIKEDDSMIPDVASMTFALESSALCFATATTWHKRLGHQNMEFIKRMSSNPLFNNLRVSDEEFQDS